ncbi:MAG: DUF1203 domain-containing protein [Pseudoxanthomonas sp.]
MAYRISGLAPGTFQPLFAFDDARLAEHDIRRVVATDSHGYPCRVSLEDAEQGETLLLLPYEHHAVAGPYRASGPIYVRENAQAAAVFEDSIPPSLGRRLLSVRAYDIDAWMHAAEVVEGQDLEACISDFFALPRIEYLHIHNARPGCYSCRVDRC